MEYFNCKVRIVIFGFIYMLFLNFPVNAQSHDTAFFKLPVVELKTLEGKKISSSEIINKGTPIVLIFWKSCCPTNIVLLDEINEVYSEWQSETGVIIYAVSIDDSRSSMKIKPLVDSKQWNFNLYLDPNSDFKRAMNVLNTPHIFFLNGNNDVVEQMTTCSPGDVEQIYQIIKDTK